MKRIAIIIFFICVSTLIFGCSNNMSSQLSKERKIENKNNEKIEAKNTMNFTEQLTKMGYNIETVKDEREGLFTGSLTVVKIGDNSIGVYEYMNNELMEKDASAIKGDGSAIGNAIYEFKSVPHFYKKGNILVSYIGNDKGIMDSIEKIIGKQFIGGNGQ